MNSIDLIRGNLRRSEDIVLARIGDMRAHGMTAPTPNGGCHTLWVLGHLAYIEALVIQDYMLGTPNPLAHWAELFDGADVSEDPALFPSFDELLGHCRSQRANTMSVLDSLTEPGLDQPAKHVPTGAEDLFCSYRDCLQHTADHWFMHRGQLADSRRAAGIGRSWY